jgi:tRNA dimethylallyltransferase
MADRLLHQHIEPLLGVPAHQHVVIAGPTASGKSALALALAERAGGVIVNADASQVYDCWRVITARPSVADERRVPHLLYGHVSARDDYSTGHWLRDVAPALSGPERLIIVGGTGLYLSALTQGLADIPAVPKEIRMAADSMGIDAMLADLDATTRRRIDTTNRARVQRAWEVLTATGRSLPDWQDTTGPGLLPLSEIAAFVIDAPKDWLTPRIEQRFDQMIAQGALDEAATVRPTYDPSLPAHRAIGVPELMAHLNGDLSLQEAKKAATIATRQFAKRQRTWFRSRMSAWTRVSAG